MLRLALVALVLAVVSAALGFGGLAAGFATLGKFAFLLFAVLFVASLVMHVGRQIPGG